MTTLTPVKLSVARALRDTAEAHHRAFASTDGADPDWALWYADQLIEPLSEAGLDFTRSGLVYCLLNADNEHDARASDRDWPEFYADLLVDCHAASDSAPDDRLILYHFEACPYCARVRRAIERLGIDVELRDVREEARYRDELIDARGRATVPVLRIISPQDEERWMPESRDIVNYLERTYGTPAAA